MADRNEPTNVTDYQKPRPRVVIAVLLNAVTSGVTVNGFLVGDLARYTIDVNGISGDTIQFEGRISETADWRQIGVNVTVDAHVLSTDFPLIDEIRAKVSTYDAGTITVTLFGSTF